MVAGAPVGSTSITRDINPDADGNARATNSPSSPPAPMADGVVVPSTRSSSHSVAPLPLPPKSPSRTPGTSVQPSDPPVASISKSQPSPPPPADSPFLPRSISVPASSSPHLRSIPDQHEDVVMHSVAPVPQPQQLARLIPPTSTPPPVIEAAETNADCPEALSSTLAKALFDDSEDLSAPSDNGPDRGESTANHRGGTVKRPRAASSPAAKTPSKPRRKVKSAGKPSPATSSVASRPPQSAQSHTHSQKMEVDGSDDMDIGSSDGADSEHGEGSSDEDKERNGDKFGGNEKAGPVHGRSIGKRKGKAAVRKVPSPRTTSAILCLGKDIPAAYEPLGDPIEEGELLELDWLARPTAPPAKPSKTKSMVPISAVSPPVSQMLPTRRWSSFAAPQMTLNPELEALGEVELSDGAFRFPFDTQVIKYSSLLNSFLIGQGGYL